MLWTTYQNISKNYVCLKLKWKQTGLTCILRQLAAYSDIENLGRTIGRSATHQGCAHAETPPTIDYTGLFALLLHFIKASL